MMNNFPGLLSRPKRPVAAVAAGVMLVAILGCIDFISGQEVSFSIFYLLPISLAAVFGNAKVGWFIAVLSAVVWLISDLMSGFSYSHAVIPYWNAFVRLAYFILHSTLITFITAQMERERSLARVDPLTKTANWRRFEESSSLELLRARRTYRPLTIAYIDLDNFKTVNDRRGHDAGDAMLKSVAERIKKDLRATDMLARLGGDEFVVFLPETGFAEAEITLLRIHERLQNLGETSCPVSASIGAVTFGSVPGSLPSSVDEMLKKADDLMYRVKHEGKNRVKHEDWRQGG